MPLLLVARILLGSVEVGGSPGVQSFALKLSVSAEVALWTLAYAFIIAILSAAWPIRRSVTAPLAASLAGE